MCVSSKKRKTQETDICKKKPLKITKYYKLFFECHDVCGVVLEYVGYKQFSESMEWWKVSLGFKEAYVLRLRIPVSYGLANYWAVTLSMSLPSIEKLTFAFDDLKFWLDFDTISRLRKPFPKFNTIIMRDLHITGDDIKALLSYVKNHGLKLMAANNKENIFITQLVNPFIKDKNDIIEICYEIGNKIL